MTTLVFAGSFKPAHYGHLNAVLQALEEYRDARVRILISSKPRDGWTWSQGLLCWTKLHTTCAVPFEMKTEIVVGSPVGAAIDLACQDEEVVIICTSKDDAKKRYGSLPEGRLFIAEALPGYDASAFRRQYRTVDEYLRDQFGDGPCP